MKVNCCDGATCLCTCDLREITEALTEEIVLKPRLEATAWWLEEAQREVRNAGS